jgi:hypothetical protein
MRDVVDSPHKLMVGLICVSFDAIKINSGGFEVIIDFLYA